MANTEPSPPLSEEDLEALRADLWRTRRALQQARVESEGLNEQVHSLLSRVSALEQECSSSREKTRAAEVDIERRRQELLRLKAKTTSLALKFQKALAEKESGLKIFAIVDGVESGGIVNGWAWCKAEPGVRLIVEVLLDGQSVGTAVANRFRLDLLEGEIGDGYYAFQLVIPKLWDDGLVHELSCVLPYLNTSFQGLPKSYLAKAEPSAYLVERLQSPTISAAPRSDRSERRLQHLLVRARQEPISIVIPVFNQHAVLRDCVESIVRHTTLPHEIVLVDDASDDPLTQTYLESVVSELPNCKVLRQTENRGFVRSANIGILQSKGDVVLLNSDTRVTRRWLNKLLRAAASSEKVATVTPLSNASGAFSVPELGVNAPLPPHLDDRAMAAIVARAGEPLYLNIPTGNGFCMFVSKKAIDEHGVFDEETFGRGYGEENDLCMRMSSSGWRHILDDQTFVFHHGSMSFGDEKAKLLLEHRRRLDERFPTYTEQVRAFTSSTALANRRNEIASSMECASGQLHLPRILYVLHEGTGGVPATSFDLAMGVSGRWESLFLTSDSWTIRLKRLVDGEAQIIKEWIVGTSSWSARKYTCEKTRVIYRQVLEDVAPDLVHCRHLFKQSFDLPELCEQFGIPFVLSFHDYYFIHPSIQLVDRFGIYRPDPGEKFGSIDWNIPSPLLEDLPSCSDSFCAEWQSAVSSMVLARCSAFVTTSDYVRKLHKAHYPQLEDEKFIVVPHGRDIAPTEPRGIEVSNSGPLKLLVLGNLDPHKGSDHIFDIATLNQLKDGPLEIHLLGWAPEQFADIAVCHGGYDRENVMGMIQEIDPDVALLLPIWAETYSHTLTECWAAGLPVFSFNLGAIGERISRNGGGWLVDPTSKSTELYERLVCLSEDRQSIRDQVEIVGAMYFSSIKEMAVCYDALYLEVLGNRQALRKILVVLPTGNRASSFVRCILPLAQSLLRERFSAIFVDPRVCEPSIQRYLEENQIEQVHVQREALDLDQANGLIAACKSLGLFYTVDLDDDIFDRGDSVDLEEVDRLDGLERLLSHAHRVSVSTDALATRVAGKTTTDVRVIPNALDHRIWRPVTRSKKRGRKRITLGYFGTKTHTNDLSSVCASINDAATILLADFGIELRLRLVGAVDSDFLDRDYPWIERVEVSVSGLYTEFIPWLIEEGACWDIGIAPLVDSRVNRSKSALKYFEYGAMGLPCIASNLGEYPSVISHGEDGILIDVSDNDSWVEWIVRLSNSEALRSNIGANALSHYQGRATLASREGRWMEFFDFSI